MDGIFTGRVHFPFVWGREVALSFSLSTSPASGGSCSRQAVATTKPRRRDGPQNSALHRVTKGEEEALELTRNGTISSAPHYKHTDGQTDRRTHRQTVNSQRKPALEWSGKMTETHLGLGFRDPRTPGQPSDTGTRTLCSHFQPGILAKKALDLHLKKMLSLSLLHSLFSRTRASHSFTV